MMRILVIAVLVWILGITHVHSQETVRWMDWNEGLALAQKQNKKVIIDLYTKWCGWCKKMDSNTFQNEIIANYINQHYIAIKLDAETQEDLEYNGKKYQYVTRGKRGYNELAVHLTDGQLRYPTIIFLDESGKLIQSIPSYQNPPSLERILHYFAGDNHHTTPWVVFSRNFKSSWRNTPKSVQKKKSNTRLVSGQYE